MIKVYFSYFSILVALGMTTNKTFEDEYQENTRRVANGWPGKLGDVPYQIAFKERITRSKNLYMTFCGGVIIAPKKLISAAHCFIRGAYLYELKERERSSLSNKYAVAGNLKNRAIYNSNDSPENGQWRQLDSVEVPHSYRFPMDDIALVYTKRPFIYNTNVRNIEYASRSIDYVGRCLVSGFGRDSEGKPSSHLVLGNLTLLSKSRCTTLFGKNMHKFICAKVWPSEVKMGDSGGPLVCRGTRDPNESHKMGVLVGIVSGIRRKISVFTRVSTFKNFIDMENRSNDITNKSKSNITNTNNIIFTILEFVLLLKY